MWNETILSTVFFALLITCSISYASNIPITEYELKNFFYNKLEKDTLDMISKEESLSHMEINTYPTNDANKFLVFYRVNHPIYTGASGCSNFDVYLIEFYWKEDQLKLLTRELNEEIGCEYALRKSMTNGYPDIILQQALIGASNDGYEIVKFYFGQYRVMESHNFYGDETFIRISQFDGADIEYSIEGESYLVKESLSGKYISSKTPAEIDSGSKQAITQSQCNIQIIGNNSSASVNCENIRTADAIKSISSACAKILEIIPQLTNNTEILAQTKSSYKIRVDANANNISQYVECLNKLISTSTSKVLAYNGTIKKNSSNPFSEILQLTVANPETTTINDILITVNSLKSSSFHSLSFDSKKCRVKSSNPMILSVACKSLKSGEVLTINISGKTNEKISAKVHYRATDFSEIVNYSSN
ncbi:hypothetical protein [Photobacterium lipolyticum]|uniref:Uncharacterized protein n=1 Tax=Photobacterium lipolyticum TaxID=266810 RepID=A0A2T3N2X3_9GAMM|nr:hypothetical protein [Photobacterium lipolyticum]PSW06732.1 hypothetical protein C9I89_04140 [Photobacterium lipolyticum]